MCLCGQLCVLSCVCEGTGVQERHTGPAKKNKGHKGHVGGSLKEESIASESTPPSAPQPVSEVSVFQDWPLGGGASLNLNPERGGC